MFVLKSSGFILLLALTSVGAFAQTGTITGQVVDDNGQPVANAPVQIRALQSNTAQTVISNRFGEFQAKSLDPVDYYISVSMPSYVYGYAERIGGRTTYRIGDVVRVTLLRGGVVTGKVTNGNDDPVVGVHVRALMVRDPHERVQKNGFAADQKTDDRGVYRIYGLRPGTYVVFAGGSETTIRTGRRSTFELDAPTYAPSATRENAAEISIKAGAEVADVDIRYRGEQGRSVSGAVTVPAQTHERFWVTMSSAGDEGAPWLSQVSLSTGRNFVFNGVADGDYILIAHTSSANGEGAISDLRRITVRGADVTGIQLTATLLASVSGRVVLEETKAVECTNKQNLLPNEVFVDAAPKDPEAAKQFPPTLWALGAPVRPDNEGNFAVLNLVPGAYSFGPRFQAPRWYVNSIVFVPPPGGNSKARPVDAARAWTNVKGSDRLAGLTITLVHGAASFQGYLAQDESDQGPARFTIYLVPAELEKANDPLRFFAAPVSARGPFSFNNLPPGRYWIIVQPEEEGVESPLAMIRLPHEAATRTRLRREAEAAKNEIELKPCQVISNFRFPPKPPTQN